MLNETSECWLEQLGSSMPKIGVCADMITLLDAFNFEEYVTMWLKNEANQGSCHTKTPTISGEVQHNWCHVFSTLVFVKW